MTDALKIDRRTTTPFLLRLFYRSGSFHRTDDFVPNAPLPPHVQIYTWQSCSLKELSNLIASALPNLFPRPYVGTRLCFRLVFADTSQRHGSGRYTLEDIGTVVIGAGDGNSEGANGGQDDKVSTAGLEGDVDRTLHDARFVIGDYISCAILPPSADGEVAPPPSRASGPRSLGPSRQNGFGSDHGAYGRRGSRRLDRDDRRAASGVPPGDWRRGDVPPSDMGGGYSRGRGRPRGRGW